MGTNKDTREAVEAELEFDPLAQSPAGRADELDIIG
jgi:hypothetical protein